jgi:hypothetical protein
VDSAGVLFSLGSNGDFSFERSMLNAFPNISIHTFDCTGDFTALAPKGITFHNWCLGSRNEVKDQRVYKTWPTILADLNIKRVDYLKMDIEGFEWNTLPYILEGPAHQLPSQISFELHLVDAMIPKSDVPKDLLRKTGNAKQHFYEPVMRLFHKIVSRGYGIVSNEINSYDHRCSEFVLVLA